MTTPDRIDRRTRQVIFKVTDGERKSIMRGAGLAKMRYSTWARAVLLAEVERLEREAKGEGK